MFQAKGMTMTTLSTPHVSRLIGGRKTAVLVGAVALVGVATVPAVSSWQIWGSHVVHTGEHVTSGASVPSRVRAAVTNERARSSSSLVYRIPEASAITTAPYVIGLENFAALAVSRHRTAIVVSGVATREEVAVAILRSALTQLHSHIEVTAAPSSNRATGLSISS